MAEQGDDHDLLLEIRGEVHRLTDWVEDIHGHFQELQGLVQQHAEHLALVDVWFARAGINGTNGPGVAAGRSGRGGRGYYLPRWAVLALGAVGVAILLRWVTVEVDWHSVGQAADIVEKVR